MDRWAGGAPRKRILVVDDDPDIVDLIMMRLDIMGHEPRAAANGFEALVRISELKPAAMILDINMPQLDGFGVLSRMGREKANRLPTLVLTARNRAEDVRMAMVLGARDYLAKPLNEAELLKRVSRLLRRSA